MDQKTVKNEFVEALLDADSDKSLSIIKNWIESTASRSEAESLLSDAMDHIGFLWEQNSVSLAQIYIVGNIIEQIISKVFTTVDPVNEESSIGFAVLCDHHNLGMKIVSSYLKSKGVHHRIFGVGLEPEELVLMIQDNPVQILLLSVLMLPSTYNVKILRRLLNEKGLGHIKIIVGGAPFRMDLDLWKTVDADAMALNSISTYQLIRNYLSEEEQ